MKTPAIIAALIALTACSQLPTFQRPARVVEPTLSPGAVAPPPGAITAQALDTTTAAEKAAALASPASAASGRALGRTIVSLGLVTEPGIWLRSSLVKASGKGRVVTSDGTSIAVDLIPGTGAAQLSLAAFRALKLTLTDLPEVTIFAQ